MKKITLLGSKDSGEKNNIADLLAHVKPQLESAEIKTVYFEDLLVTIGTGEQKIVDITTGSDLADTDLLIALNWYKNGSKAITRDLGFTVALYLNESGVEYWNKEMGVQRSSSKLSTMMQLSQLGLPIPLTYFSLDAEIMLGAIEQTPFIFKNASASRGAENYLCNSIDEARQYLSNEGPNSFIVQEFIENDSDLRIVCFGGEPSLVIERRRASDDTHLNNTSQGGGAKLLDLSELSQKTIEECRKICYSMHREMAGIDLLPVKGNKDKYVYLEVNAVPQLTSGSYIEEKMSALAKALNN